MRKFLFSLIAVLLFAVLAHAETATRLMGLGISADQASALATDKVKTDLKVLNASGTPVATVLRASGNTSISGTLGVTGASTLTGAAALNGGGTVGGPLSFSALNSPKVPAGVVVTPATAYATPGGAFDLAQRISIVAAAAPTANFVVLPLATPHIGSLPFQVWNRAASNPVAIQPQGTDVINAAAAATPYSCAGTKLCECEAVSAGQYVCTSK